MQIRTGDWVSVTDGCPFDERKGKIGRVREVAHYVHEGKSGVGYWVDFAPGEWMYAHDDSLTLYMSLPRWAREVR